MASGSKSHDCGDASLPCSQNSREVIYNKCVHGRCCNLTAEGPFCKCEKGYHGDRCDDRIILLQSKQEYIMMTVTVVNIIVFIAVIVVIIVLVLFYIWYRRKRQHQRQAAATAASMLTDNGQKKPPHPIQPGYSWRQSSTRHQLSTSGRSRSLTTLQTDVEANDHQPLTPKTLTKDNVNGLFRDSQNNLHDPAHSVPV